MNEEDEKLVEEVFDGKAKDAVVTALIDELKLAYAAGSGIKERRDKADAWRYCIWPNQQEDGRKAEGKDGEAPIPFKGAPDNRIHLVDGLINENVVILLSAFWGAKLQAEALNFSQLKQSGYVSILLEWLRDNALRNQLTAEVELLANMQEGDDPALAILGVFWDPHPITLTAEFSPEQLIALGQEKSLELEPGFFDNPNNDRLEILLELFGEKYSEDSLAAGLKDFDKRRGDTIEFAYRAENGLPSFQALQPGRDIWMNWAIDDLQDCPSIFMREELSKDELASRVDSMGYDESWVEEVISKGTRQFAFSSIDPQNNPAEDETDSDSEYNRVYEIFRCYRKVINPVTSAPQTRSTVFSYFVPDLFGLDEAVSHARGLYPFVQFRRERVGRGMLATRGISRIAGTQQNEIKVFRDTRGAAVQLAAAPPIKYKMVRGGLNLALSPWTQVPVRNHDDFQYAAPPPYPDAVIEMERSTREDVDDYFFRSRPDGTPTRSQIGQAKLTTNWLNSWAVAFGYALSLCQEHMDQAALAEILSVRLGEEVVPNVGGDYSLRLHFDVRDLDVEFVKSKFDLLGSIFGMDTQGLIDRGMVADMMHAVDPMLARHRVKDIGAVTDREKKEVKQELMQASVGMLPEMREDGQNFQVRLQAVQEELQRSPKLMQQYKADEQFREIVDKLLQHYQFMLEQQKNAQTGRIGVKAELTR